MLRRLYDRLMVLAAGPNAWFWLAVVAVAEGVFFPIPPDTMLLPMVIARRDRWLRFAGVCLIASLMGGAIGYGIGYFLEPVGRWLFSLAGHAGSFDKVKGWYDQWGALLIVLPIPYKLIAITSGLAHFNFPVFLGASALIRGLRFTLVAWLAARYGEPIRGFVEKRLTLVALALGLVIVAAFAALKFLI